MTQGMARDSARLMVPLTDPVAADGEFTVEDTDIEFAGFGLPFKFNRHYRSGVDFVSILGAGWNYSYGLRLYPPTSSDPQGVTIVTERMSTLRFTLAGQTDAADQYEGQGGARTYRLQRLKDGSNAPWVLEDPEGRIYRFHSTAGSLESINDYTGHLIRFEWQSIKIQEHGVPERLLIRAIDTTGRSIYFNYEERKATGLGYERGYEERFNGTYTALACISLSTSCDGALVKFQTRGVIAQLPSSGAVALGQLTKVVRANGDSIGYDYFRGGMQGAYDWTLGSPPRPTVPWYDVEPVCAAICGEATPGSANSDACALFVDSAKANCAALTDPADKTGACYAWCMGESDYSDFDDFRSAMQSCGEFSQPKITSTGLIHLGREQCREYRNTCEGLVVPLELGLPSCRQECYSSCVQEKRTTAGVTYGVSSDLWHNLTRVIDGNGRVSVENRYGEDPGSMDFDKVIRQVQGTAIQRFTYYDLSPLGESGRADDQFVSDAGPAPVIECGGVGFVSPPGAMPRFASVLHDAAGTIWTQYFDAGWEPLSIINRTASRRSDFRFLDGNVVAMRRPSGERTCIDWNDKGRPTLVRQFPAPGRPGAVAPHVTRAEYDDRGLLTGLRQNATSPTPYVRSVLRDSLRRVVAVGESVDEQRSIWTCFEYADPEVVYWIGGSTGPPGDGPFIPPALPRKHRPGRPSSSPNLPSPSGCAAQRASNQEYPSLPIFQHQHDVFPARIIHPDGSSTAFEEIGPAGPGITRKDATGKDPIVSFARYNEFGQWIEAGRILGGEQETRQPLLRRGFDRSGQLQWDSAWDPGTDKWWSTRYGHDRSGHVTSIETPTASRTLVVDVRGNVVAAADAAPKPGTAVPRASCMRYDGLDRLIDIVKPEGNLESYRYSAAGELTDVIKGNASGTLRWASRCTPVIVPPAFSIATGTEPRETARHIDYDAAGFPISEMYDGVTVDFITDGFGRIISVRTPSGSATTPYRYVIRSYDDAGRVVWDGVFDEPPSGYAKPGTPINGLHALKSFEFDWLGRPTRITHWRFDPRTLAPGAGGLEATLSLTYDDTKDSLTTVDADGLRTNRTSDPLGRLSRYVIAPGESEEATIAINFTHGGTQATVDRTPAPTHSGRSSEVLHYDLLGRLISAQAEGAEILRRDYDYSGRPVGSWNVEDGASTFTYDPFGRLSTIEQALPSAGATLRTRYEWDRNDRLTAVTDAENRTHRVRHDAQDRVNQVTDAIGSTDYSYVVGSDRISSEIRSNGSRKFVNYDPAGRVSEVRGEQNAQSLTRRFAYTALDELKTASQVGGTGDISIEYDSLGRRVSEEGAGTSISLSYTPSRVIETLKLGAHSPISIGTTFDRLGRTSSVDVDGGTIATLHYDRGALDSIQSANSVKSAHVYDDWGALARVNVSRGIESLASMADGRGGDGVVRVRARAFGSAPAMSDLYTLDELGRLHTEAMRVPQIAWKDSGWSDSEVEAIPLPAGVRSVFELDGASNWKARSTPAYTAEIGGANEVLAIDDQPVVSDAEGRVLSAGATTYSWNAFGELESITNHGATTRFEYDALGRRTKEHSPTETTDLWWDDNSVRGFGQGGSSPGATIRVGAGDSTPLALVSLIDGSRTFVHGGTDGSPLALSDNSGKFVEGFAYSAYGEPTSFGAQGEVLSSSTTGNRFLYRGYLYEPDQQLYLTQHRDYQPRGGRFLAPDPAGLQGGLNRFSYVGARPLALADPEGLGPVRQLSAGEAAGELFRMQREIDQLWQPQMFKGPFDFASVSPTSLTPWVVANAPSISGFVQGFGNGGNPQYFVTRSSNDAYHLYTRDGAFAGYFGVRSTATGPGLIDPIDIAAGFVGPVARGGSALFESLVARRAGSGAARMVGDEARFLAAEVAGSAAESRLPTVTFDYLKAPNLVENMANAMRAGYAPGGVLTYAGPGTNSGMRYLALKEVRLQKAIGMSWDEFPFASTIEGGRSTWLGRVLQSEQNYQGGVLGAFYKGLVAGQQFRVVLINMPP
jgi:RHS repeat-associated protein